MFSWGFMLSNAYQIITCPKVTLTRLHKALPLDFAGKIELDKILKKIRWKLYFIYNIQQEAITLLIFFLVITEPQRNDIKRYGSPGIQAYSCDFAVGASCCHRRVFFNLSCLQFLLLSYEIQTEISKKIGRVWNQSQVKREEANSEHCEAASHDHSTNPSLGISALQKELQGHIRLQESVNANGKDGIDLDIEIFL